MWSYHEKVNLLGGWIASSRRLCIFTGAGISCPSGIPDFRSVTGLFSTKYGSYSPEIILSHSFYIAHTDEFFRFYREKMLHPGAKPNAAHHYFASLENENRHVSVVTQNVDGLHTAAGSGCVYELHGNIHRNICNICGRVFGIDAFENDSCPVPRCPHDGGVLKPDVVLYEEQLCTDVMRGAAENIAAADTVIAVGTSLSVYPAAAFLDYYRGIKLVIINRTETPLDDRAAFVINEDIIRVVGDLSKHALKFE